MDAVATKAHAMRDNRIMEVNFQECKGTTKSPVAMLHDWGLDFMVGANFPRQPFLSSRLAKS
jgi:hypothetical protein